MDRIFIPLNIALLIVSDTARHFHEKSGATLDALVTSSGHRVVDRKLVMDDQRAIVGQLEAWVDDPKVHCVITSGGTGITGRDVTPEAFHEVLDKEIPGFGELFRAISLASIGHATIFSRALAGVAGNTYLFALPGPKAAVAEAWEKLLGPLLDNRTQPRNFAELLPRLAER